MWRESPSEPIRDYCLNTVTFGTASAPFTAIRTIKELATNKKEEFPIGCSIHSSKWNCGKDTFKLQMVDLCTDPPFTKRRILSNVAKIFDPMGWVQPLIVPAKILIQDI